MKVSKRLTFFTAGYGQIAIIFPFIVAAPRYFAGKIELGELMCRDALNRRESCGGHFREESQTEENEAKRDDENYLYVSAWQHQGDDKEPVLHKEPLAFESIHLTQRSYK